MNRAYKFRLYPTKTQEEFFMKTFGCVRFIYNKMLEDKIAYYRDTGQKLNNTPAQYKSEFPWLREVDSYALCNAQIHLQAAYSNFFKNPKAGFPKFKSKKKSKQSYTTNNINNFTAIRLVYNKVRLPKVGLVKVKAHRQLKDNEIIKSATISKTPTGKYFVSILVEFNYETPEINLDSNKALGLDYSSPCFYVDSQNNKADYPKFFRESQEKLAREQRRLSHMQLGSNNYQKQKVRVAKVYEKIVNQRKDFLHKLSRQLTNEYDIICVEDINLQGLSQCLNLGKATMDNGFGMFREMLNYKLNYQGKKLVKIDKWFPSFKTCRFCGTVNSNLTLADREWLCDCGQVLDRDYNAAVNILNAGLASI